MQRHYASLPGYVRELIDANDWRYWRQQVAEYQYAHRPHRAPDGDA